MCDNDNAKADRRQLRNERIRRILHDCIVGRAAGEMISDESVLETHPDLKPELVEELRGLQLIESARRRVTEETVTSQHGLHIRCPHCHNSVELIEETHLSDVRCSSCGSAFGLAKDNWTLQTGTLLGQFEVLNKLGVGAFGSVWRARDTTLDRLVAIKIPHKGQFDPDEAERFIREARVAARLSHQNIVKVHEVGREADRIYLVTDFVNGQNLADWLAESPPTSREAVKLCVTLADALHHAHEQGVIHRDLKPSNIMMDANGDPHLMDFGLAKQEAAEITMTMEGKLLGTPAYMSPEQARGTPHAADRRSDIYSLGVILFELLTGERPFRGTTQMLVQQTLLQDAPSLRKLNNAVPKDLETICLRCLEKDANRRYQTAAELADDLRRFLVGQPVHARPIPRAARAWRWCTRNPLLSGLAGMLVLALVGGFAGVTLLWIQATRARDSERQLAVNLALDHGLSASEQGNVTHGMHWMARSLELNHGQSNDLGRVIRVNLAVWRSSLLSLEHFLPDHGAVYAAAFSPDGQTLVTGSGDGTARLWNRTTGQQIGQPMVHEGWVVSVAFSPNGKTILTGSKDKTARLWDAKTGEQIGKRLAHEDVVLAVAFSSDGKTIITGAGDGVVQLWNTQTGERIGEPMMHGHRVSSVAFSPQSNMIMTGSEDKTARLWDAKTGKPVRELKHQGKLYAVAFSPDGARFVTGGDVDFLIWDTATLEPLHRLSGHAARISAVAFSPDGAWIVAGGVDARTRLWDVETGRLIQQISVLTGEVRAVAFSPGGSHIFIGSSDHAAHLYDATDFRVNTDVFEHDDAVWGVAFAPDGNTIVTGSNDGLRVWDVASLRLLNRTHGESAGVAYHKNGATIVAAHRSNNYTQLWEVPALKPVGPRMHHGGWVGLVSFKPDGTQVLTASFDQNARLWDALTGKLIKKLPHQDRVTAVAFSPDGKTFLTGAADKSAQLWDAETYQSIGVPLPHQGLVLDAEFSLDGAFFATASSDGAVWLWNANTRRPVYGALQHDVRVRSLAFSPDGAYIATGCEDGTVRFWDVATGKPIALPRRHNGAVYDVPFSPDGARVASASWDGTVRMWDAPPAPIKGDVRRIVLWTQVITAQELDEAGAVGFLDRDTWIKRRLELQALGGPPIP